MAFENIVWEMDTYGKARSGGNKNCYPLRYADFREYRSPLTCNNADVSCY